MKNALPLAALAEIGTGLALIVVPSLVAQLLLGDPLTGVATVVARVAGFALVGLGIACWPGPARRGMMTYSVTIAFYLAFLGIAGSASGPLLWPAFLLHIVVAGAIGFGSARSNDVPVESGSSRKPT